MDVLDPYDGSYLLKHMSDSLSKRQIRLISTCPNRRESAQCFIDMLSYFMTPEVFIDFMIALGEMPNVRKEISDAYWAEGGVYHKCSPPCC